jgi:hypothetical protein
MLQFIMDARVKLFYRLKQAFRECLRSEHFDFVGANIKIEARAQLQAAFNYSPYALGAKKV